MKATNDLYDFKVEEEKVPQNLEILVMLQRFLVIQDHRITLFSDCAKNDIFVLTNHPIGILAIFDFSNLKKMCSPDTLGLKM